MNFYYYQVIPARNLPFSFLTYKSTERLEQGALVEIPIGNSKEQGMVFSEIPESGAGDLSKVKSIILQKETNSINLNFSTEQINFLKLFSTNTFNSFNQTLISYLQPLKILTKKDWKEISFEKSPPTPLNEGGAEKQTLPISSSSKSTFLDKKEINGSTNFFLDTNITIRIMYLIRTIIYNKPENNQILIIFPEKKLLDRVEKEITENFKNEVGIKFSTYSGDKTKKTKTTVIELLKNKNSQNTPTQSTQIIFSTRNGIFLPFSNLTDIILVDEANSMYIQDQNSLYYDARDAIFLLSKAFKANLNFVSTLPSIRLYSFYTDKVLEDYVSNNTTETKKALKIKISKLEQKYANFDLFSDRILDILDSNFDQDFEGEDFGVFEN